MVIKHNYKVDILTTKSAATHSRGNYYSTILSLIILGYNSQRSIIKLNKLIKAKKAKAKTDKEKEQYNIKLPRLVNAQIPRLIEKKWIKPVGTELKEITYEINWDKLIKEYYTFLKQQIKVKDNSVINIDKKLKDKYITKELIQRTTELDKVLQDQYNYYFNVKKDDRVKLMNLIKNMIENYLIGVWLYNPKRIAEETFYHHFSRITDLFVNEYKLHIQVMSKLEKEIKEDKKADKKLLSLGKKYIEEQIPDYMVGFFLLCSYLKEYNDPISFFIRDAINDTIDGNKEELTLKN